MKKITIRPVTRIEGHAAVDILLDDKGRVKETYFHVEELRGFERFCQGRKVWEMPRITSRICGICSVSHHLASAKTCDNLFGVEIPETAALLRELMHMGQIIHSHSLHFFFLAAPDLLVANGPELRNIVGIVKSDPALAKKAIQLRKMGQDIIHATGGKAIHPVTAIPGGITKSLSKEEREKIEKDLKIGLEISKLGVGVIKQFVEKNLDMVRNFADIKTGYMGLVNNGNLEMYDGKIRLIDNRGKKLEEFDGPKYLDYVGEHVENWSYLKFPFYKKAGWPKGIYRVGPLGRTNVCDRISTPVANGMLNEFRKAFGCPASPVLLYNYARMIETVYAAERAQELVANEKIIGNNLRTKFEMKAGEGVGVIEAPRGTLYHHYKADDKGNVTRVNLIVSTVNNNPGMNLCVKEAVMQYVHGKEIDERALNKVEMAIRAYDPCLSCATHAIGQMPFKFDIYDSEGRKISEVVKNRSLS